MRYSFRLAEVVGHVPDPRRRPGTIKAICEYTGLDRHQVAALLKNEVKYIPLDALSKLCAYLIERGFAMEAALRSRGVDVVTALQAGRIKASDEEQFEYAAGAGRAIHSFNVGDFYRLHGEFLAAGRAHSGIILSQQQQFSIGEQMRRLLNLIAALTADEMSNRVEFLGAWG